MPHHREAVPFASFAGTVISSKVGQIGVEIFAQDIDIISRCQNLLYDSQAPLPGHEITMNVFSDAYDGRVLSQDVSQNAFHPFFRMFAL